MLNAYFPFFKEKMIQEVVDFLYTSYAGLDKQVDRASVGNFLSVMRDRIIIARDTDGKVAACAFYLKDKDTLNFLFLTVRKDFDRKLMLRVMKELIKIHGAKKVNIYRDRGIKEYLCRQS